MSGGVLVSIQGGRARDINKDIKRVDYEGTACSAMDEGEIGLP